MPLLVMGIIYILGGLLFYKILPPKNINWFYGWRTSFSMKNQDTWDEAQKYAYGLCIKVGVISLIIGFILLLLFREKGTFIGAIGIVISFACLIIVGEIHLRKVFDNTGLRKKEDA